MTTFHLFRHAESVMNLHPELVGGQSNGAELTPNGRAQARKLGRYITLSGFNYSQGYVSEAIRTQQTFTGAFCADLPVLVDRRLNELSQGEAEGILREKVYTKEVLERMRFMQQNFKLPGGESMNDVAVRMWEFFEDKSQQHGDGRLAVVTSGIAIKAFIGSFEGRSHKWIHETPISNASLTVITMDRGVPRLVALALDTQQGA